MYGVMDRTGYNVKSKTVKRTFNVYYHQKSLVRQYHTNIIISVFFPKPDNFYKLARVTTQPYPNELSTHSIPRLTTKKT